MQSFKVGDLVRCLVTTAGLEKYGVYKITGVSERWSLLGGRSVSYTLDGSKRIAHDRVVLRLLDRKTGKVTS